MKSYSLPLTAALFASSSLAAGWLPSCTWSDCLGSWDGTTCDASSGWECVCSNQTAISQLNTCVATSCTNQTDQEAIYGAVAQLCANAGVTVTNSQQATFSATSGGSAWPTITSGPGFGPGGRWDSEAWSSWVSAYSTGLPAAPSGWDGKGPWGGPGQWGGHGGGPGNGFGGRGGPGGFGPWGTKAEGINCDSWTTWTAGWGPLSSWTGTWSGCSTTTAAPVPATVTTTVTTGGVTQVLTGTTFGIQAVVTTGSDGNGATSLRGLGACGALFAAIFATMIVL
ncbi:hypothetical protein B0A52_08205 [Exophiala mesophila]|uniref:CFEM domain-containing protein n=1 Tax=Exophiala mesophila TaxID=212818 RepID=A0A438MWD6_EXOME|nr:hypothetical protein B0A52_08205 [Exophiala mesophila]